MSSTPPIRASQYRWRILAAAICGVVSAALSHTLHAPFGLSSLVGWNAACLVYLLLTSWLLLRDDEATVPVVEEKVTEFGQGERCGSFFFDG